MPPSAFVSFIQNHDQIGNRAFGERLNSLAPPETIRALASVYLLVPQIPMLFMGEEWGAQPQPFLFFCDFGVELMRTPSARLARGILTFPRSLPIPERVAEIPDPLAEATFLASKLDWSRKDAEHLAYYRELLDARRDYVRPLMPSIQHAGEALVLGEQAVRVSWRAGDQRLVLDANLSARAVAFPPLKARVFWRCGDADGLGPWSVRWGIEPA